MEWPAFAILAQNIFHIVAHCCITFPCTFLLFGRYLQSHHTVTLKIFFMYLFLFGFTTVINNIYLLIFWDPLESRYFASTLAWFGMIPWALQFPCWNFEFFVCLERCIAIGAPSYYTQTTRKIIAILALSSSAFFIIVIYAIDKLPIIFPIIPTTCKFYGCLMDTFSLKSVHFGTIGLSVVNFCTAMVLLVLIRKYLHNNRKIEKVLCKTVFMNILISTLFQWFHPIFSILSYQVIHFTLHCLETKVLCF